MKEYTIIIVRFRRGELKERKVTGTLEYLISYFDYTLEVGRSWEWERRENKKINTHPKTAKSLVTNLNNAVRNSAANGCPSEQFYLES